MAGRHRRVWPLVGAMALVVAACEFEAELPVEVTGDVEFVDDGAASNGRFARIGPGGSATYEFKPNPQYQEWPQIIWVRTRCTDAAAATMEVVVDAGPTVAWPDPCVPDDGGEPTQWSWTRVGSPAEDPATFDVSAAGIHEVVFTGVTGEVEIDKMWVGLVGSSSPQGKGLYGAGIELVDVQAEAATGIGQEWEVVSDPEAYGGAAIRSLTYPPRAEPDLATETITVEGTVNRAGTYRLWTRSKRPHNLFGTMWVRVNGGEIQHLGTVTSSEWTWSRLSSGGTPVEFSLAEGPVRIEIQARSFGLTLDQLTLTNGAHHLPSLADAIDPFDEAWAAGGIPDMVTEGDHQYVAYYNADARITVAHRTLTGNRATEATWDAVTLDDPRAVLTKGGGFDTHNYLTMVVDSAGILHLAGNMHVEPMTYYRTTVPHDLTTLVRADLAPEVDDMPEAEPGKSTYPEFIESPDPDELFFQYRGGTSGDGEEYLNRYDVATGQWSVFEPAGTDPADSPVPLLAACDGCQYAYPCDGCQREYAYNKLAFDGTKYHLAWVWRTWDRSDHTNVISSHDISYAWSYDLENWYTASDTAGTSPLAWPLTYDGPEGYAGERAEPDPAQDPKVIEWLPPGSDDIDDPLETRLGGGLHNSYFDISFTPGGDPVVSYSKFAYRDVGGQTEVDSVIVNARLTPGGQWELHQLATAPCPQTTTPDEVGPASRAAPHTLYVEDDGTLSQEVKGCTGGWRNYALDPVTAAFGAARDYREYSPVPTPGVMDELEVDHTRRDFCGDLSQPDPGKDAELDEVVNPRTIIGHGDATGGRQFFLRWHQTPGNERFERPDYCQADPLLPSELRLYEAKP